MSDTLTRDPLLTSRSFVRGHSPVVPTEIDHRHQPLGYLYSQWDGSVASEIFGEFDKDSQTWISPPGLPTAGVSTYTQTNCYSTDRCWDDSCG